MTSRYIMRFISLTEFICDISWKITYYSYQSEIIIFMHETRNGRVKMCWFHYVISKWCSCLVPYYIASTLHIRMITIVPKHLIRLKLLLCCYALYIFWNKSHICYASELWGCLNKTGCFDTLKYNSFRHVARLNCLIMIQVTIMFVFIIHELIF